MRYTFLIDEDDNDDDDNENDDDILFILLNWLSNRFLYQIFKMMYDVSFQLFLYT